VWVHLADMECRLDCLLLHTITPCFRPAQHYDEMPQLTTPPHHPQQLPQLPLLQVCVTGMGRWADRLGLPIIAAAPAHHTCLPRGASPSPPSVVGQGPRSSVRGSQYIS
jgi:hypothetical protein